MLEKGGVEKGIYEAMDWLKSIVSDAKRNKKWSSFHIKPNRRKPTYGDDDDNGNSDENLNSSAANGTDSAELREKGYKVIPDFTLDENGDIETEAMFKVQNLFTGHANTRPSVPASHSHRLSTP